MRKEELQELVTELQDICNSLSSKKEPINDLIRLSSFMGKLKNYPEYCTVSDEMLDVIQTYDANDPYSLELIIAYTEFLISIFNEILEKDSILDLLKMGFKYKEIKDMFNTTISREAKDICNKTASQLKDVCKGKADIAKDMCQKAEKTVKCKLRNWLLSDDDE